MHANEMPACFAGLLAAMFVSGCGKPADGPDRVAASGTVTLDGEPLPHGVIRFIPVDGTEGPKASAVVEQGAFEFPSHYGPVPGMHRIEIETVDPDLPDPDDEAAINEYVAAQRRQPAFRQVPRIYNRASQLKEQVTPEGPNEFEFELVSRR